VREAPPPAPLLCLTTSYPRAPHDAAGSFVAHLNARFAEAGWAPRVVCLGPSAAPLARCPLYGFPLRAARAFGGLSGAGGAPDWLQRHPAAALAAAPLSALSLARALAAERAPPAGGAAGGAAGARVAHWLLPCALLPARGPAAHVSYAHGGDVALLETLPGGRALARLIDGRAARAGGALCFVSDDLRARFEGLLGAPLQAQGAVLPMGVDAPRPCARYEEALRARAGGRLVIATVGRLTPLKGLDVLAEALAALPAEARAGVLWLAAGEGPERARLEGLIARHALPAQLLGHLAPPQRDALLRVAAVLAQPSRRVGARVEGSPVALMEAAAAGCAVVCTRAGGAPALAAQLAPAGGAWVVEEGDPRALRDALRAALHAAHEGGGGGGGASARALRAEVAAVGARWLWSALGPAHAALLASALSASR